MRRLFLRSRSRVFWSDITEEVEGLLPRSGGGICLVFCPHTTASVMVNEGFDPNVVEDIVAHLSKLVPSSSGYLHAEGNSDAHIKSSLLGCSAAIGFSNGKLELGRWQRLFFVDFDGPREREIWIKVVLQADGER